MERAKIDPAQFATDESGPMIAVIADDFSGAAELAGMAHGHGLRAEIWSSRLALSGSTPRADLVAIDTDTRLLSPTAAAETVRAVAAAVRAAWLPEWIYKKTDSVLRGNIAAELRALREATGGGVMWFVPANPSKGRVVRRGDYFLGDTPLDRTLFANDPIHPARTAAVRPRLGLGEQPGDASILTPDAEGAIDLERLATGADVQDNVAGAADFFDALLRHRLAIGQGSASDSTGYDRRSGPGWRAFVCGSQAAWPDRRREFATRGWPVGTLDRADTWESHCRSAFWGGAPAVLLAIGDAASGRPEVLCGEFADAVVRMLLAHPPASVLLEGGATAVAVLRCLGAERFRVIGQLGVGAPWLEALDRPDLPLWCAKPGSYPWPEAAYPD